MDSHVRVSGASFSSTGRRAATGCKGPTAFDLTIDPMDKCIGPEAIDDRLPETTDSTKEEFIEIAPPSHQRIVGADRCHGVPDRGARMCHLRLFTVD
jgi:hypothetical protein